MHSNRRTASQEVQDGPSFLSPPTVTMYSSGHLKAEVNIADSDLLFS